MKSSEHPRAPSRSCSCTSCMYKSESERPSVKQLIAEGSRIDKLYYGKYIPLRERKLLDKLVRTRAVYDDIRNQLVSESDTSIKEKPTSKPKKRGQVRPKEATDKRSSILELVEMVDKGKVGGGKPLSDCCSCCSCGSKLTHSHEHTAHMRRHRHAHGHAHGHARGHAHGGSYTTSRTSMIRKKMGEVRRNVKFKAKSIRSAPCTCTSKLSGMIKRQSQEMIKRLRPEGSKAMMEQAVMETYEQDTGERKRRRIAHKIKKSKTRIMQSMGEGARRLKESQSRLKERIETDGKKSLEKIKHAKHKMRESIKTAVRRSVRKNQRPSEDINFEQTDFLIKKDSITKFKEKLQRRKRDDYYACEHECIPDECVPEDCYKIIKLRRRRVKKSRTSQDKVSAEKNTGVTARASSIAVQAQQKGAVAITETEQKEKIVSKRQRPSAEKRISVDVGGKKTGVEPRITVIKSGKDNKIKIQCACEEVQSKPPKETKSVHSATGTPPLSEPVNQQEAAQPKKTHRKSSRISVGIGYIRKGKTVGEKAPPKGTAATKDISMKKESKQQSSQTKLLSIQGGPAGNRALKRCFCTLKLKGRRDREKPTKSTSRHTTTSHSITSTRKLDQPDTNVEERVQTKRLKKREMECIECLSGECDPRDCIRTKRARAKAAGVNVKPRQKSVSSLASRSVSTGSVKHRTEKKVENTEKRSTPSDHKIEQLDQSEKSPSERQAVRIGSTFSFSIEFYKDKPNEETLALSHEANTEDRVKKHPQHSRGTGKKKGLRHRHSQISSSTGKSKYTLTKHSLRRCFCTLKLAHGDQKNKKNVTRETRSQGSATSHYTSNIIVNANKAIATDKKYKLSPYECEPGVCVPGECDPYVCIKRINERQAKYHTKQSNTDNRRAKSTSSFTSRSIPNKAKKIQSTTATYESPSKKHKDKGNTLRRIRTTPSSPERQVVRITSSFSFNVEFYKENPDDPGSPQTNDAPKERPSKSSMATTKPRKDKGYQEKVKRRQKSTSTLVKKKNRGSFIAPAMKRCFCTLKLQKTKVVQQKKTIEQATIGTRTPDKNIVDYRNVMVTKGTKTKQEKHKVGYTLEPYECEPYVCVPGECDPYECLKRIQMRQLKESGTLTDKAKMKSGTSITRKSSFRSRGTLVKSKHKRKKASTNIINVGGDNEIQPKPQRQAVRIGSAFSFNIEFHKDLAASTPTKDDNIIDVEEFKAPKKVKKVKTRRSGAGEASSSNENTQVAIKHSHKGAGIRPMLKRCFCTLKLQEKNNRSLKPHLRAAHFPNVVTVSRVTVAETKVNKFNTLKIIPSAKTNQGFNWAAAMYNINSSSSLSKSSIVFEYKEMKSYFHNKNSIKSMTPQTLSEEVVDEIPDSLLVQSNVIIPTHSTEVDDKFAQSENCILRRVNIKRRNLRKRSNLIQYKNRNMRSLLQQQNLKFVGYNQISRPRYFAMNVQVPQGKHARKPGHHKLKPYECEPGICLPGECDPYECEKLIKRRLMKRVDRMSGTNIDSKSTSSAATQPTAHSKAKRLQSRQAPREKVKTGPAGGIKYESAPSRKQRQAVRVGSSFSFNIEFSKNKSSPPKYTPREAPKPSKFHKPTGPPKQMVKAKGTKGHGVDRRDQDSQSRTLTEERGSGMKPMMQRCFCTLKLQKKGKSQKVKKVKPIKYESDKGTATPPNSLKEFVASRTMMNTGQNTAKPNKLLPYECEPNICVPGECDPYECLERIKQRNKKLKDSGTGAMRYKTSSSSNTGQQIRTQARHIQSKPRRQKRSKESAVSQPTKVVTHRGKPSRQAVRVGSSFSFNVEFFKEKSQASTAIVRVPQRPSVERVSKPKKQQQTKPKRKVKGVGLQDEKKYKHQPSQMGNVNQVKSTMTTSFIKRCFCTAKLHQKEKTHRKENVKLKHPAEKQVKRKEKRAVTQKASVESKGSQAKATKSFMEKCLCVLKLKKGDKKSKQKSPNPKPKMEVSSKAVTVDKKITTAPYKSKPHKYRQIRNLEPYECEPGICVPGECNPYECEKLIKARNVKLDTRGAFTDRAKTKSTSSSFKSSKTSKARRIQSNTPTSTMSRQQSTKVVKETPSIVETVHPNRQLVRIGSNFSFNIEFYKDRSPNTDEVQAAAKAVKQKPPPEKKVKTMKTGKHQKSKQKGSEGSIMTVDRESQANRKMEDRGSEAKPGLKRCFCTLKLQKHDVPTATYATQKTGTAALKETPTHQSRGVMTTGKTRKLKPYECEPHVCIPYECDPYECEKLIKLRNLKNTTKGVMTKEKPIGHKLLPYECEPNFCVPGQCDPYACLKRIKQRDMRHRTSGTSTKRYRGKSTSSDIGSAPKAKARKVQSPKSRQSRRSRSISSKPFRSKKSLQSTRQSVKIGSGFSFDIEFSKNKSNSRAEGQATPVKQRVKRTKSMSSSVKQRAVRTKDSNMQYRKNMRDTDSQMFGQKMHDTGVNPFLKRCFCTLKLQKSGEVVSRHAIGRAARDRNVYLATLLPYECEPGVCVPSECDPYECEKRIRMRQMRSQRSGTEKSSRDTSTTSTGAKQKATKSQAVRDAQARRRQKSTYAKKEYKEPRMTIVEKTSSQSSSRQAVRIGSSFKFDIEFFKDHSSSMSDRPRSYSKPIKPVKRVEHVKTYKPVKTHTRSRSVTSSDIKRQHNKMQTKASKTESKSTGFGPLLKRCFCTLALHKQKSPPTSKSKATYRNDDLSDLYQYSRNVGVGTKQKYPKLKSYECEPGVCIPGQCDPYECYERIKRRLRDTGTGTPTPRRKYASSVTSKSNKYKSANTQSIKDKRRKERPSMTSTVRERVRKQRAPRYSSTSGETNRQAVKIGSNFSFSVEFFKERPNAVKIPKSVYKIRDLPEKTPKKYKNSKTSPSQKNVACRTSCIGIKTCDRNSQGECIKNASKGTTMGAFIKRCFCTLNLHKNPPTERHIPKTPKPLKVRPSSPPPETTKAAIAQTKEKYTAHKTLPYKLKPYECEPNVCVPGECNPYECLERIKRRNIRRHFRRTGTHKRTSQVSVSSMTSRLVPRKSRRLQSREKRTRMISQPQQIPRVVEQPRFTHLFDSPNRTGVKVGSNISFNIEFYKDKTQAPTTTVEQKRPEYTVREREPIIKSKPRKSTFSESRPKGMHKGTDNKFCNKKYCEAQTESAMMKSKAAGVNNMLKRCFCTLKLQKNAIKPQKIVTVNRVEIENNFIIGNKRVEGVANKHTDKSNRWFKSLSINECRESKKSLFVGARRKISKQKGTYAINEAKEMKTLYPYTPTKFNKNLSKTILIRNPELRKKNFPNKPYIFNENLEMTNVKAKPQKKSTKNLSKFLRTLKESGENSRKESKGKIFLHKLFTRLFSKKNSEEKQVENVIPNNKLTNIKNKVHHGKPDTLKFSKSDRQPMNIRYSEVPKQSRSLKMTKPSDKKRTKEEIYFCQKYKKFSHYQYGDTKQVYPKFHENKCNVSFSPQSHRLNVQKMKNKNQLNVSSPYASNKIVQMALVKSPKSANKKSNMVSTKTNTEVKKTITKGVDTNTNDTSKKKSFLNKCMCFIQDAMSKKDTSLNKNKETLITPEDFIVNKENKTSKLKKKNTIKGPSNKLDNDVCCPCTTNDKTILSPADKKKDMSMKNKSRKTLHVDDIENKFMKDLNKNKSKAPDTILDGKICCPDPRTEERVVRSVYNKNYNIRSDREKKETLKTFGKESKSIRGRKKSKFNRPDPVLDSGVCCPCSQHTEKLLSSGDNQVGQRRIIDKSAKSRKSIKKVDFNKGAGESKMPAIKVDVNAGKNKNKTHKKKSALQSGDAPDITKDPIKNSGNKNVKLGKIKTEKSTNAIDCKYPIQCPCCPGQKAKERKKKSKAVKANAVTMKSKSAADAALGKTKSKLAAGGKRKSKTGPGDATKGKSKASGAPTKGGGKHLGKFIGAKITIKAKGPLGPWGSKTSDAPGATSKGKEPCVCGTKICAEESNKMKEPKHKTPRKTGTPCICGSHVCSEEAKKVKRSSKVKAKELKHLVCQCNEEVARRAAKAAADVIRKKKDKEINKIYDEHAKKCKEKRSKLNKVDKKHAKLYKSTPDGLLVAESFIDVCKLAVSTISNTLRCASRAAMNPRGAYDKMHFLARNPKRSTSAICEVTGEAGSTCKRIQRRCCAMKTMKLAKDKMESNAITHFLLHAADKDPKKRIFKKKKQMKRRREPIDFECSLFMASLRRRPCLAVYYTCPWFYPHCLSMLTLWKQFTDVMLFLIAVAIWSPCIVGMELFRAFVCCFFCTG